MARSSGSRTRAELRAQSGAFDAEHVSYVKCQQVEGGWDIEGSGVTVLIGGGTVLSVVSTFAPGLLRASRQPAITPDQATIAARKDMGVAGGKAAVTEWPKLGFYKNEAQVILGYRLALDSTRYLVDARPATAAAVVAKWSTMVQ